MSPPGADDARSSTGNASRPRAWWLILTARVLLLAVAAAGAVFALLSAGREAPGAERYRCPMHPEVITSGPATCPVCGMALVRDDGPPRVTGAAAPPAARTARPTRRRLVESVRAPAWVDANGAVVAVLYRDDIVGLAAGQPAQFFPAAAPSDGIDGTALPFGRAAGRGHAPAVDAVLQGEAATDWDAATAQLRFQVTARAAPAGSHGSLVIAAIPRDLLVVPSSAILDGPDGPYVLTIDPASAHPVPRPTQIGRDHHGVVAVLSGLSETDDVVIADAFFVAAERVLHPEEAP